MKKKYDTNIFNNNANNRLIREYNDKKDYTNSYNYSMSVKSLSFLTNKNINSSNISNISGKSIIFRSDNNDKINKALEEIFYFYSKKHNIIGYNKLFESIEEKKKHLDLNEFSKFCKDFNIPISNQKIVEIFKKNSSNLHLMKLEEFKNTVQALSQAVFESNKKLMKENLLLKEIKLQKLEQREEQEIEEEKMQRIFKEEFNEKNIENYIDNNNSNLTQSNNIIDEEKKQKYFIYQKNKLKNEISKLKDNYKNSINKSFKENFQSFCEFLKLTSSNRKYRENMKGYKMPNLLKTNKVLDINRFKENQKNLFRLNKKKNIYINKHRILNINNKNFSSLSTDRKYKGRPIFITSNNNKNNNTADDDLKNRIWWSKLKNYNIKELNMSDKDKDIFSDLDKFEDVTLYNIMKNKNKSISLKKVKLNRNKSDIEIKAKNKNKIILPPILNNKKDTLENKIKKRIKENSFLRNNDKKFVRLNNYSSMFLKYNKKLRNKSSVNISNK